MIKAVRILHPELFQSQFTEIKKEETITYKGTKEFDVAKKPKLKKSLLRKLWEKKDEVFRDTMHDILGAYLNQSSTDCINLILSYHGPFIISKIRYSVDLLPFFDQITRKSRQNVWNEAQTSNKYKFVDVDVLKISNHASDVHFGNIQNLLKLWKLEQHKDKFADCKSNDDPSEWRQIISGFKKSYVMHIRHHLYISNLYMHRRLREI